MSNSTDLRNPMSDGYSKIYSALNELRESFHRSGRLDDSNAKLDEVSKLFATYLAFKNGQISSFPKITSTNLILELQQAFQEAAALSEYRLQNGNSIFGNQATLAVRDGDELLAIDLVKLVTDCIDMAFSFRADGHSFDILNEAFGHFVRDNFRGNVEDAQYMTPPEVVDFMVDMVFHDISSENPEAYDTKKHWTVLDPSCGVGSFLAAVYDRARGTDWLDPLRLKLYGQDKVERMVRFSTINLNLFNVEEHKITVGNSLEVGSPIDKLNGTVDIILTNPPFGARFDQSYVSSTCGENTPFFSSLRRANSNVDSELLFIDRNLKLLKEGGRLLIVVPDGVVSAKGTAALIRQHLAAEATIKAIIELPATTFAQAGTRTKTAILYLQKGRDTLSKSVFMGVSKDLGFQVSMRKGTQIKIPEGKNDLKEMLATYKGKKTNNNLHVHVLSEGPSCVLVPEPSVLKSSWTPSHYSASRFKTVDVISRCNDFQLIQLKDLVEFCSDKRKAEAWQSGWAYISILHILGEGFVDVRGAFNYFPKTPGVQINPGEILLSRINPRIPRVCIAPDFKVKTLCSSEFEVMKVTGVLDVYTLAYLLLTDAVQNQICSLTSGTSASHNRIRTSELGQVLIPVPVKDSEKGVLIGMLANDYRKSIQAITESTIMLANLRKQDNEVFDTHNL